MKRAHALVMRGDALAGTIERTAAGAVFEYDASFRAAPHAAWDRGIAYRLPYDTTRIETRGTNLHPFFAGLLPEGLRLDALVRKVKTSKDDLLSLLIEAGDDCVGDISVVADDTSSERTKSPLVDIAALPNLRFTDILRESLAGKRGPEPTLPGVQDKVSAAMISVPLRAKGGQRAYILKLNPAKMPRLVENEHFFLRMARACGLDVARAELVRDREGAAGLLVERFDRIATKAGLTKVHQEDACQFLERYPADKYVLSHADIARGITELASAPIVEISKYLRLIAFSYLVANGDLHAKNISLRTIDGRVELTPAYDLLSSLPYGDRTLALAFDGRDKNLKRRGFVAFGERHGVRRAATVAMLDELCDVAPAWIARLEEVGLEPHLVRVMNKRRAELG